MPALDGDVTATASRLVERVAVRLVAAGALAAFDGAVELSRSSRAAARARVELQHCAGAVVPVRPVPVLCG